MRMQQMCNSSATPWGQGHPRPGRGTGNRPATNRQLALELPVGVEWEKVEKHYTPK